MSSQNASNPQDLPVRKDIILLLILIVLSIANWLPRMEGPIDFRWDAASYFVLGQSLSEGKGYRLLNEPGEIRSIQDPPLLPTMVAVANTMLGTSDPVITGRFFRFLYMGFYIIFVAVSYIFAREYLTPAYSFLVGLICVLSPSMTFISDVFYAEVPFGILVLVFLLLYKKEGRISLAGTYLTALVAFSMRTAASALLAAWVIDSLMKRKWKTAAVRLLLALVPVVIWLGYVSNVKASMEYTNPVYQHQRANYAYHNVSYSDFIRLKNPHNADPGLLTNGEMVQRFFLIMKAMPRKIGSLILVDPKYVLEMQERLNIIPRLTLYQVYFFVVFYGLIVIAGLVYFMARDEWVFPVYAVISMGFIALWPATDEMYRFLTPLLPIFLVSFLKALLVFRELCRRRFSLRWKYAYMLPLPVLTASLIAVQAVELRDLYRFSHQEVTIPNDAGKTENFRWFYYPPSSRALDESLNWLKMHGDGHQVMAIVYPHHAYLRTGIKSVKTPYTENPEAFLGMIDSASVTLLIEDRTNPKVKRNFTRPALEKYPDKWLEVFHSQADFSRVMERSPDQFPAEHQKIQ